MRKDTPSLIGPQEHLGRSRTRPFAGDRYTGHRERSGYEATCTVEPRLSEPLGAAGGSDNRNVRIIEIGVIYKKRVKF